MIATIISFSYFVFLLSNFLKSSKDNLKHYVIFATALSFSVAANGLISMLIVATKLVYIPLIFIHLIIFISIIKFKELKEIFYN